MIARFQQYEEQLILDVWGECCVECDCEEVAILSCPECDFTIVVVELEKMALKETVKPALQEDAPITIQPPTYP